MFDEVKRIYVATSTANVEAGRRLKSNLRQMGFEITHDWTGTDHIFSADLDSSDDHAAKRAAATADQRGVRTADLVIYLAHERCFGANIELGMALAYGVEVWVVDPVRDSVFFELDAVTIFPSIEEVKLTLRAQQAAA